MNPEKSNQETAAQPVQKLLVRLPEAAAMIGESEKTVRRLIDMGELLSTKRGGSRVVLVSSIHDFVSRLFQKHQRAKESHAS